MGTPCGAELDPESLEAAAGVGAGRGGRDAHDLADLVEGKVGAEPEVQGGSLARREPVDDRPQAQAIIDLQVDGFDVPIAKPADDLAHAP
jgi:hypothetical protein